MKNELGNYCRFEGNALIVCSGMKAMLESVNPNGIGVNRLRVINLDNGEDRDAGIYFKFPKKVKDNKLCFNVCPFCEERVLMEKRKQGKGVWK